MKLITILFFVIRCAIGLFITAWNILAFLTEVLVNEEENTTGIIGNHLTVGGNDIGDDSDIIKRAGDQYISDRDIAIYHRINRH
jgi:hypothetical protein